MQRDPKGNLNLAKLFKSETGEKLLAEATVAVFGRRDADLKDFHVRDLLRLGVIPAGSCALDLLEKGVRFASARPGELLGGYFIDFQFTCFLVLIDAGVDFSDMSVGQIVARGIRMTYAQPQQLSQSNATNVSEEFHRKVSCGRTVF